MTEQPSPKQWMRVRIEHSAEDGPYGGRIIDVATGKPPLWKVKALEPTIGATGIPQLRLKFRTDAAMYETFFDHPAEWWEEVELESIDYSWHAPKKRARKKRVAPDA